MNPTSVSALAKPSGRRGWLAMVVLASLVSLASARYVFGGAAMIPPPLASNFLGHTTAFYIHIAAASIALLFGPWQFLGILRRSYPLVHRSMGVVYVAACLIGGLAAFPMAIGSNGGPVAAAGFLALATLWLWTTGNAVLAVVRRDFASHAAG